MMPFILVFRSSTYRCEKLQQFFRAAEVSGGEDVTLEARFVHYRHVYFIIS